MEYGDSVLPERFWAKVHPEPMSGCWLWGASCNPNGYGKFFLDGRLHGAHVLVAQSAGIKGDAPVVRHDCDTPPCVNPRHLRGGTQLDNVADMNRRGRHGRGFATGERNPHARLTVGDVELIRNRFAAGTSLVELAQEYDSSWRYISKIVNGTTWASAPGPIRTRHQRKAHRGG